MIIILIIFIVRLIIALIANCNQLTWSIVVAPGAGFKSGEDLNPLPAGGEGRVGQTVPVRRIIRDKNIILNNDCFYYPTFAFF